jgi:hypothetical protein
VDKIVEMRRYLVLDKAEFPKEMQTRVPRHGDQRQPVGHLGGVAGDWAKDLPVVTMARSGGQERRSPLLGRLRRLLRGPRESASRALVEILNAAGVSFAILGTEETCNGDSARRMGNEYLFQMLAQQNVETLNATA